jgi:hypothetical protein
MQWIEFALTLTTDVCAASGQDFGLFFYPAVRIPEDL